MSRIKEVFEKKKGRVLNVYCTAGFPELKSTMVILESLQNCGADMVELGIPYSDPLADGPVIQSSSARALKNGMTIGTLLEQLEGFRDHIHLPVILMGYLNPILQYGFKEFCAKAAEVGIDGLIIPDLPMYEFKREYQHEVKKQGLDFIFLVTPETSIERVRELDQLSSGFLYAVSSSSVTGSKKNFVEVEQYLSRLKDLRLNNPILAGFGINNRETFFSACKHVNGAIIGSAFIRAIEDAPDIARATKTFLDEIVR